MEPKPLASLSAGLLARKGDARPAMRRPYIANGPIPTLPLSVQDDLGWNDMGHDEDGAETLSPSLTPSPPVPPKVAPPVLVDLPVEAQIPATASSKAPVSEPPVIRQQQELAKQFSTDASSQPASRRPAVALTPPASKTATKPVAKSVAKSSAKAAVGLAQRTRKAAFTLRIDPERHLRLRLACAVGNRSAQQIVIEALDAFLEGRPELDELARQVSDDQA